jgi:hypothetical protein
MHSEAVSDHRHLENWYQTHNPWQAIDFSLVVLKTSPIVLGKPYIYQKP